MGGILGPIRFNPVPISIRQLDVAATHVDSDFNEPISRKVEGTVITVDGQINFGNKIFNELEQSRTGDELTTVGHLLFRKCDLDNASLVLKKGDRVVAIASQATDLIIREVRPESPLNGDFLLIYCELEEDREKHASTT